MINLAAIVMLVSRRLLLGISLYAVSLVALAIPWLQRHVLYLHRAQWPTWWANANKPEQFGFAKNQVTPFTFTTPDHEAIHSWHIIPLSLYSKHEFEILQQQSGCTEDITRVKGFELLRDDPESRLIISFHGNAGNVAQGWRSDSYRVLSNSGTFNTHILAIDYRGFGFSSGSPTEEGLIIDGIAAVNWAMEVAQVSPDRIVILGHSLGTAVTAAVVEHFAVQGIEFAGTILLSGFARLQNLLSEFCLVGWLFPLRIFPPVLQYFKTRLRDTWSSTERIANFVRVSKRVRLFIVHSLNDPEILPHHADELFDAAINATVDGGLDIPQLEEIKQKNTIDIGDGAFIRTVRSNSDSTDKIIRQDIVPYGYHSLVLTYNQVSLAVLKAFELNGKAFASV